jgi:hypothetical protein
MILATFTTGLIIWILIPSVASSLQTSLETYSKGSASYLVVAPGHSCPAFSVSCPKAHPEGAVKNISEIKGVDEIHQVVVNLTFFFSPTITHADFTAVLGGSRGFPFELLSLQSGGLPADGPDYLYGGSDQLLLSTARNGSVQVAIGCYGCPNSIKGPLTLSPRFNATGIGQISLNPLFGNIGVMWNSTFLAHTMGALNYSRTFGGSEPNYLIIKVNDIKDLPIVANETANLIRPYTWFSVRYDQALAQSLQSFTSQTGPLYQVIGAVSLVAVTGISYLATRVIAGKRDWEGGLLLTQGSQWNDVKLLYMSYFLLLGLAAFAGATIISFETSHFFTASYRLFTGNVTIQASIIPTYVLGALIFILALSYVSAFTIVRRLRKLGLDTILREH